MLEDWPMLLPVVWSHAALFVSSVHKPSEVQGRAMATVSSHVRHPGHSCGETVSCEPFLRAKLQMLPLRLLLSCSYLEPLIVEASKDLVHTNRFEIGAVSFGNRCQH